MLTQAINTQLSRDWIAVGALRPSGTDLRIFSEIGPRALRGCMLPCRLESLARGSIHNPLKCDELMTARRSHMGRYAFC